MFSQQNPSFQFYTWGFQSCNRDTTIYHEPNNFSLPVQIGIKRPMVSALTISSLEMELKQYTVENLWNKIYYDEGWQPFEQHEERIFKLTESKQLNQWSSPMLYEAMLPLNTNFGEIMDNGNFIFEVEHGLTSEIIQLWNSWNGQIYVIDKNGQKINLKPFNVQVLDKFEFKLKNGLIPPGKITLKSTPIPSPSDLAKAVSLALKQIGSSFQIKYDQHKFSAVCGTSMIIPQNMKSLMQPSIVPSSKDHYLMGMDINGIKNLVTQMGFAGNNNVPVSSQLQKLDSQPLDYQKLKHVWVEPGNYTEAELVDTINNLFNNPSQMQKDANVTFSIGYHEDNLDTVSIPLQSFSNMNQYIIYLQNEIETTLKRLNEKESDIFVHYDCGNRTVKISSTSGRNFIMTFSNSFLGFEKGSYKNMTQYTGSSFLNSTFPTHLLHWKYQPKSKKIEWTLEKTPTTIDVDHSELSILDYPTLKIGDVLEVWKDKKLVNYVVIENIDNMKLVFSEPVSFGSELVLHQPNIYFNIYLHPKYFPDSIPSRYLGYPCSAQIEINPLEMRQSEFCMDISPPKYLLLMMFEPVGSTKLQTSFLNEFKTPVAKIILNPEFKLDRIETMQLDVSGIQCVTRCHFQILNPDFTEYQFHGADWSGSIIFAVLQEAPLIGME